MISQIGYKSFLYADDTLQLYVHEDVNIIKRALEEDLKNTCK